MRSPAEIIAAIRSNPKVPVPYKAVFKVLELTRKDDCEMRQVAVAVGADGGLTASLLRQANSALYGASKITSSVQEACVRLGLKRIRTAVINEQVVNGLSKVRPPGFDAGKYWQSTFAASVAARNLATLVKREWSDDAGTAGLLCDLGIGLLAFGVTAECQPVLARKLSGDSRPFHELEQSMLGVTHAQVGAAILENWKLEPRVIQAVREHHAQTFMNTEDGRFSRIVAAGSTLSEIAMEGSDMDRVSNLFAQIESLSPQPDTLVDKLLTDLAKQIQEAARSFSIEIGPTDKMEANFDSLLQSAAEARVQIQSRPMSRAQFENL